MEKVYSFDISFDQDLDGRWSAWLTSYPACGTWGDTRDEAAEALADMTLVFLEVMQDSGERVYPDRVETDGSFREAVVEAVGLVNMASVGGETIRIPMPV